MRPRLQLALDMTDLSEALRIARLVQESIDVIEVGTLLCLSEGMNAIRAMRAEFPDATIVGDVRIARAGENIARMAFDAGADWISAVAEAPVDTLSAAAAMARERRGELQVELGDEQEDLPTGTWNELGIGQVIFHATSEVGSVGGNTWTPELLSVIAAVSRDGFRPTVTGGITPDAIPAFAAIPVFVFIAGRAICNAGNPAESAQEFRAAIEHAYG